MTVDDLSEQPAAPVDILLVDDQPKNLVALEAVLSDLGQNLVKAGSGKDALREVLAHDFAVILLDVQMPDMDGYETASMIHRRKASRHIPIIFLTAGQSAHDHLDRGYDAGAVDYLFKPIDPNILRSKVSVFVELARKTALLERRNRELAQANEEIEAFAYTVSHDLRAPLRSIDRFSEALLEDCGEQIDETGKRYLTHVRDSAKHMATLIDGLLALARVSRAEVHRQPVDLSRIAREVAARLDAQGQGAEGQRAEGQRAEGQRAEGQRIERTEFAIDDGLLATGDPRLLAVVLDNLMGNAWKFTRKSTQPRIEVKKLRHDGGTAFCVRDNGAGFDMAYADKLFRAFQRLHAANEFDGHGIGLATVQRIVRRHGGRVWADGKIGAGAAFYFTLGA